MRLNYPAVFDAMEDLMAVARHLAATAAMPAPHIRRMDTLRGARRRLLEYQRRANRLDRAAAFIRKIPPDPPDAEPDPPDAEPDPPPPDGPGIIEDDIPY
jgi:hypothetical protein